MTADMQIGKADCNGKAVEGSVISDGFDKSLEEGVKLSENKRTAQKGGAL